MRSVSQAVVVAVAMACSACATYLAPAAPVDYDAVDRLKTVSAAQVAVGTVQPTNPDAAVNRPRLRGAHFASPSGTFVKYIEDSLVKDLKEAGLYAADAATRIDATVVANDINVAGLVTGNGTLVIDLTVSRGGQQRLAKTYRTATQFDSAFMGTIAIQQGQAAYPVLVRTALKQIYADPEFINAIRN